ncbi:hypothetical protein F183_A38830 [Bryobacterales bacterium F-183]|nr:hypothetical protein F183_A38830 [Bryobacterales bacterium F-183]
MRIFILIAIALSLTVPTFAADELGEQLLAATRKGDLAAMKALLDKGADVNTKTRYGSTPLFFACDRGNAEAVKLLIDRGANLNVKDTFYNATALGWAMSKKHEDIMVLLMERGVDLTDALLGAVQENDQKLFQLAMDKGKLTGPALDSALLAAKFYKRDPMVKALLDKSAHDIEIQVPADQLPAYAGKYAEGEMTVQFGTKDGKLSFQPQNNGGTPLAAIGKDKFRLIPQQLDFNFVRDANGAVESVRFESRGGEVELMKSK